MRTDGVRRKTTPFSTRLVLGPTDSATVNHGRLRLLPPDRLRLHRGRVHALRHVLRCSSVPIARHVHLRCCPETIWRSIRPPRPNRIGPLKLAALPPAQPYIIRLVSSQNHPSRVAHLSLCHGRMLRINPLYTAVPAPPTLLLFHTVLLPPQPRRFGVARSTVDDIVRMDERLRAARPASLSHLNRPSAAALCFRVNRLATNVLSSACGNKCMRCKIRARATG